MSNHIISRYESGCHSIVINRPEKRNALTPDMIMELTRIIRDIDDNARYVTIQAEGPSFCAGADIQHMKDMAKASPEDNRADAAMLASLLRTLYDCPHPVVIACQGSVTGGGIGLLACADIVIADDNCEFRLSEVSLGITPGTIAPYVIHAMRPSRFRYYATTAKPFTAKEAKMSGLINDHHSDLAAAFNEIKGYLDANSPTAMRLLKEQTRELDYISETDQKHGVSWLYRARHMEDAVEGLTAFLEKRKPNWKG